VRARGPDGAPVASFRFLEGSRVDQSLVGAAGGNPHEDSFEFTVDRRATAFVEIWDARDAVGRRLPLGHVVVDVPVPAPARWTVTLPAERSAAGRVVGP